MATYARLLALVVSMLALSVSFVPSVRAQSEPAAYRDVVREALSEYHAKNFPEARALFEDAHRLFPNARTLRGLGMTAFELRSYPESIGYLKQALDSQVKPLDGNLRLETERLLSRAERFAGTLNLSVSPQSAEVMVDGKAVTLDGKPLVLEVGNHSFEFHAEGYLAESRSLYVKSREVETWTVVLNKAPAAAAVAAAPVAPSPAEVAQKAEEPRGPRYVSLNERTDRDLTKRPVYKNPWLWTGVGVAVVAVVVTGVVLATRDKGIAAPNYHDGSTPDGGVFSALQGHP